MCQVKKENTYVSGLAFWFEMVLENMEIMKVLNTIIQILFWKVRWKKNEKENEPKYFHQRWKVFALQKSMYEAIFFRIEERFLSHNHNL